MEDFKYSLSVVIRESLTENCKGVNQLKSAGTIFYAAGRDGIVRAYDSSTSMLDSLYAHHKHWVNSIELTNKHMISASLDSRILIWDIEQTLDIIKPVHSIAPHSGYIYSLKRVNNLLYSAGESGLIAKTHLDDGMLTTKFLRLGISVWNLDCTENLVGFTMPSETPMISDSRTEKVEIQLKGHKDYVRKINLSPDGTRAITCSSDCTIKMWDLGTRKAIETMNLHRGSVFALKTFWEAESFLSGDRNGEVYETRFNDRSTRICQENSAILDIEKTNDTYWVASTSSTISAYSLDLQKTTGIKGKPELVAYKISDNKEFIITKDIENSVKVFDVLQSKWEDSKLSFEETLSKNSNARTAKPWFTVNLRLGCLMLDFTYKQSASALEISRSDMVSLTEIFLRKVFFHLILKEEEAKMKLNGITATNQHSESSGLEESLVILNERLPEKTSDSLIYLQVKDLGKRSSQDFPLWLQRLIFRSNNN